MAISLLFAIMGLGLNQLEGKETYRWAGWAFIIFFGLVFFVGLYQISDRSPALILTEKYLLDYTNKLGKISWQQIRGVTTNTVFNQSYISLDTTADVTIPKKQSLRTLKFNKSLGILPVYMKVSLLNITPEKLEKLIQKLSTSNEAERANILRAFRTDSFPFKRLMVYMFIVLLLLYLTLQGMAFFITIMAVMGVSTLIAKWYNFENRKPAFVKYAERAVYLGLINIVVAMVTIQVYEKIANGAGTKIAIEIVRYHEHYQNYPSNFKVIQQNIELNLLEELVIKNITYSKTANGYELLITNLFNKKREFNLASKEWVKPSSSKTD